MLNSNKSPDFDGTACPPLIPPEEKEKTSAALFVSSAPENEIVQENIIAQPISLPIDELIQEEKSTAISISWSQTDKFFIYLSRILLWGLLFYELLNLVGLVHHQINYTWTGLIATTVFSCFILEMILYYTKKIFGQVIFGLLMLMASAAVFADALGDMHKLFDKLYWFDQIMHFFAGGVACAAIIFWVFKKLEDSHRIKVGLIGVGFITWMTTAFFGVLYELAEYFEDLVTGSHRLGDGFDTANDLMHDVLGSLTLITILVIYFYVSRRGSTINENPPPEISNS
ncbi:MAG: hypothetical protein V1845_00940 [bacterium]